MVRFFDFLDNDAAVTTPLFPRSRLFSLFPLKVVKPRGEERLILIKGRSGVEVFEHLLDQGDGLGVAQLGVNSQTRQNEDLPQVLGPAVLILARQQVKAVYRFV